ncbi:MAG: D-glycerate dehydrogenase [Alphaproteobacteria bacterium]|nr:D-glycerate dehydrogenase [Alphaproteobacteria bacterium]
MERLKVLVRRRLPEAVEARLAASFDATLNPDDAPIPRPALEAAVRGCDVLVPSVAEPVDAALIAAAGPRLRLIANFGVGVDNIDLDAARAGRIAVTNTPGVLTEDTADIALALVLMAARRLGSAERALRRGEWRGWGPTDRLGASLTGKTLAIVGMGRIGQAVARRARALGMRIDYHNRRQLDAETEAALAARYRPDLDAMLADADVVSLHAPATPETHRLLDRRRIGLLRREAFLVNTARGALVDEPALIAALEAGAIAGAGLDVYADEPRLDPRLLALENVVLLPHLGSATVETRTAMGMKVVDNIVALAKGRDLPDRVV